MSKSISYSDAGVNIDAANAATEKIKELARSTFNARTLSEIGSFGGMFDAAFPALGHPVLVASADGVGTKLKIAFLTAHTIQSGATWSTTASTTSWSRARARSSSWTT